MSKEQFSEHDWRRLLAEPGAAHGIPGAGARNLILRAAALSVRACPQAPAAMISGGTR